MKNLFVTPPLAHLELSELGTNNFYVLAQLWKYNFEYRNYVEKAKKSGRFLILDSGVGDEGEIINWEELAEITNEIKPNEVIPTDVLYDARQTIENFHSFLEKMIEYDLLDIVKIFACPQGKDINDYIKCYDYFLNHKNVSIIGLSKKALPYLIKTKHDEDEIKKSRTSFVDFLQKTNRLQKSIHCLGMGNPTELDEYKSNYAIRSIDSCYPILSAIYGIDLEETSSYNFKRIPTPRNYFELEMTKDQIDLAKKNIDFVKRLCLEE